MIAPPLLILDTHIWIWWVEQDKRLPEHVRELIEDSNQQVAVSAASVYELTLLEQRGRIQLNRAVDDWIERATAGVDIEVLAVDRRIAQIAGGLPLHHGDPLDRLVIASAIQHEARLASLDGQFPRYTELAGRLV